MIGPFAELWKLQLQLTTLAVQSSSVIGMRMLGMGGFWSVAPSEMDRMVAEKPEHIGRGLIAAQAAVMAGASPAGVMSAALKPVTKRVASNQKRLAKRGPDVTGRSGRKG
ncbi:hypothetical protein AQS8620_00917 [Aquimixticola soesokkakensis]|uniref:Antifreeze protein, type I n=1 Tax=Aquimixticola soesokkakensis TaxID=1519096 RepID=A0A1Y5S4F2_9RHOB|nr:hypothetical protein [Aquimixticola soesokkakensis]SLN29821.1 hypothetical protein AQS8620_00917 [Aquimixticola soesokkakensis]